VLHPRLNSAGLKQYAEVVGIAGQHYVRRVGQECYVCVRDISGTGPAQQFADPLPVARVQWLDPDAAQYARQVNLLAAVSPDLADDRCAGPQRGPLLLEDP
jgi:hypothetical protein